MFDFVKNKNNLQWKQDKYTMIIIADIVEKLIQKGILTGEEFDDIVTNASKEAQKN